MAYPSVQIVILAPAGSCDTGKGSNTYEIRFPANMNPWNPDVLMARESVRSYHGAVPEGRHWESASEQACFEGGARG
jgi:hypothetical protein